MIERTVLNEIYSLPTKEAQLDAYSELTQDLFETDASMFISFGEILTKGEKIDLMTLFRQIGKAASEFDIVPTRELEHHIKMLKERKYKKDVISSIESHLEEIRSGSHHDDLDDAKNGLIAELSATELESVSSFMDYNEHTNHIDANLESDKKIEGYSWGLSELDLFTSGIVVPRLIVVGGLKKSGKTRFLMHVRRVLYINGVPNIFLSLEVPAYEVAKLTYSTFADIEDVKFRSKNFMSDEERKKYERVKRELDFTKIPTECVASISIEQVLTRLRRYSKLYPSCVVFIDYLQRIEHDENRQAQELERISKQIANATRAYNISIVLLSQLNNLAESTTPSTGHLKGSGGIGEAADSIILFDNIYRRTKNESDKGKVDLILEQRYNDSGKVSVYADLGRCRFSDLPPMNI